jgi:hypothetical protein
MVVVLTDGDWTSYTSHPSGVPTNERLIEAMRLAGIVTVLAFLPTQPSHIGKPVNGHHCEFAEAIDDPHGLARLFRRVTLQRMQAMR